MNMETVIHRTKHDKKPRAKVGKLVGNPAMKELSRMLDAGEISRTRTIGYLKKGRTP